MQQLQLDRQELTNKAKNEFRGFVNKLKENHIEVAEYQQQTEEMPDSVFPNNWFSTHKGEDFPGKR